MGLQLLNLSDLWLLDLRLLDFGLLDFGLLDLWLLDFWSSLPDMSRLPDIDLPDIPNLNALGSLAGQLQAVISGAIAHPVWAIAIVLLSITLIQIVADLIKRSLKAFLSILLKLPLFISQWIWRRVTSQKKAPTDAQIVSKAEQADQLIARLEALRQEQDTVISALKDLLSQPESQSALPSDLALPSPPTPEPLSESQPQLP